MRRLAEGKIHERISAIPNAWYPAYIIRGDEKNMMIDSGVNLLGPRYLASIKETIGDRAKREGYSFLAPVSKVYSQDNAAMVGLLAYYKHLYGK